MLSPNTIWWFGIAIVSLIMTGCAALIWARWILAAPFYDPHAEPFGEPAPVVSCFRHLASLPCPYCADEDGRIVFHDGPDATISEGE